VAPRRANLAESRGEVGRDPATIAVTVGVAISYPDLSDEPHKLVALTKTLAGPPAEIAPDLRAFADLGVHHLISANQSAVPEALSQLWAALHAHRAPMPFDGQSPSPGTM